MRFKFLFWFCWAFFSNDIADILRQNEIKMLHTLIPIPKQTIVYKEIGLVLEPTKNWSNSSVLNYINLLTKHVKIITITLNVLNFDG